MKDIKQKMRILNALSYLTQLGLSIALPPVLCIFAGLWLQEKTGVGEWIIVVMLIVGLISGVCSFISFYKRFTFNHRNEDETDENG